MNKLTITKILANGGATLNKNGKAVNFKNGYQVSKKDCYILSINNLEHITQAVTNILKNIKNNEFCGLWVDSGKVYIDISIKIDSIIKAIKIGQKLHQISIFNWQNKNCIYL